MSNSSSTVTVHRFAKIHDLLSKTLASKKSSKTNNINICLSKQSPSSSLLYGLRDKIKRNEFSKVEQILASKLQFINKTNQLQYDSSIDDDFSLNTITTEKDPKQPLFEHGDKMSLSSNDSDIYDDDTERKQNDMVKNLEERYYLENKCHEIYLVRRQITNLLKEFYKNCLAKPKQMGKYCDNLVHAHKCLLIAGEEQKLIKRQIEMLKSNNNKFKNKINKNNNYDNNLQHNLFNQKPCIAIKSVSIKLREPRFRQIFLRDQTGCFLICLIEHEYRLREKPIIFINEVDDQFKDSITIDINEILDTDKNDFNVMIKFFFMFHPIDVRHQCRHPKHEINWKKFIPIRGLMAKIMCTNRIFHWKKRQLDLKQIDVISVAHCLDQQPMTSSFTLLGQLKLDHSNVHRQTFRLEQFNHCSIFDSEIILDSELSTDNNNEFM
nr:uncharacterized protein LOC124493129 [Dermatophagoides farinae]XP_046912156.1 uncharacterized protein LOC124493129 [Dermatophagoides farinae]